MNDLEPTKMTLRGEAVIAAKIFSAMKKFKKMTILLNTL